MEIFDEVEAVQYGGVNGGEREQAWGGPVPASACAVDVAAQEVPVQKHLACRRRGSQVGSHSLWTGVDGCGRLWNRKPVVLGCVDGCGRLWTRLGDLRIRRLFVDCVASERRAIPRCHRDPAARRRVQELLPGVEG